ncbi:serine hydrolase domain-containing protein [Larkinella bovis]|uniref:Serine hydrolase domain-containing protein n=1 Tax=Larkinella bovis TaxID=683041 RepID=A0ABW0IH52_9BACT
MTPAKKLLGTAFFFFFSFFPGFLQAQEKTKAPQTIPELQRAIKTVLNETGTPAVGVALVQGDSAIWVAGLGLANREKKVNATANTLFRIGSVSKMFVSLAVLKLQEEGRISLKAKVRELAPEIAFTNPWEDTVPIRVEHLLEHTTGWDDMHLADYALNDPNLTLKQGLDFLPDTRTSRWMPGTRMAYSNSGPPVAAYIIEKLTGQRFEDYIQTHFFQPLGMTTATYFASDLYRQRGATLYMNNDPQPYWNISVRPSGAINASPNDMARMLRFFINRGQAGGRQIVGEASLKRMETPSTTTGARAGLDYGYGLANYSTPFKQFVYRSHSGGVNGGMADFSYLPEQRVGYAIMINTTNGNALNRISDLIRNFQTAPFRTDSIRKKPVAQAFDDAITGYYIPINPRVQRMYFQQRIAEGKRIWRNGNFLFSRNLFGGGLETHVAVANGRYASAETGKISVVQVNDPLAGEVVHIGSQVLMPVSPVLAFGPPILRFIWILYLLGSLVFGSIWFIRYWRTRRGSRETRNVILWPFLTSLLFLATTILGIIGGLDPMERLGKIGFLSVSALVLSVLFALAAVWSVVTVVRERKAPVSRTIYWHTVVLSVLHCIATGYLTWFGAIGVPTWQ